MKKIYSSVGVLSALLLSAFAFGQQNKITEAQIKPVFEKLEVLGKQNPMGAVPLDKLSKGHKTAHAAIVSIIRGFLL